MNYKYMENENSKTDLLLKNVKDILLVTVLGMGVSLLFYSSFESYLRHISANAAYSAIIGTFLKPIDPKFFFRINRRYIIALNSFTDIISYTNSRLKIELLQSDDNDVIVAREKPSDFKKWLDH
jgi:hypothetical protein